MDKQPAYKPSSKSVNRSKRQWSLDCFYLQNFCDFTWFTSFGRKKGRPLWLLDKSDCPSRFLSRLWEWLSSRKFVTGAVALAEFNRRVTQIALAGRYTNLVIFGIL